MNLSKVLGFTYFFVILALVSAVPKQYDANIENPNNNSWKHRAPGANETEAAASDRTQRLGNLGNLGLGSTGYGSSLGGYGSYGSSYGGVGTGYGKPSIDLGGVVLGALIGIGALLILPKLASVFSGQGGLGGVGSGGYYRNTDETGIADLMSRFDTFMAQHNIDSNACMQKAVCHFVRSADYHASVGTADQIENMISTISENSIVDYMLDGTAIKDAIENAKNPNGRDCDSSYPACPLDRQTALQMMRKFLPLPGSRN